MTLTDQEVRRIAEQIATANNVSFAAVQTAPAMDSTGASAIEIKFILTPGSSAAIVSKPESSALTVSQLVQKLSDAGEERFPIIRYEEQVAAGS
jgi:hypothetical protein